MTSNIEQTYTIAASRQTIFQAISDAGEMSKWWTTKSQSDASTGGAFEYIWEFNNSEQNGKQMGTYNAVENGESITYPWDAGLAAPTQVKFSLSGNGTSTILNLVHSGWDGEVIEQNREMIAGAWQFFLGNLKSYIEDGTDNRAAAMGQITA